MDGALALYAFGGSCVALYAFDRFGHPPAWRTTTTAALYWSASLGYVAAAIAAFYLLAKLIETNPRTLDAFLLYEASVGDRERLPSGLPAPLISALFLTILLPRIPYLSKLDAFIQRAFREFGAIPRKSRELSAALRRADYETPERIVPQVKRAVEDQGLSFERLSGAAKGALDGRWLKAASLFALIEEAAESGREAAADPDAAAQDKPPARSSFTRHREEQYAEIRDAYARLSEIAPLVLASSRETAGAADPSQAADGLAHGFERDLRALLRAMSQLIACGVLSSHLGMSGVHRELEGWGFRSVARQKASSPPTSSPASSSRSSSICSSPSGSPGPSRPTSGRAARRPSPWRSAWRRPASGRSA